MVAVMRQASVPPSSARRPSLAKTLRWFGAIELIPPICIPIEAKLENPQSA